MQNNYFCLFADVLLCMLWLVGGRARNEMEGGALALFTCVYVNDVNFCAVSHL